MSRKQVLRRTKKRPRIDTNPALNRWSTGALRLPRLPPTTKRTTILQPRGSHIERSGPKGPLPFLQLPAELRNAIYDYALEGNDPIPLYHIRRQNLERPGWERLADCFALTQTNQQIRAEFLEMYYARTEFMIPLSLLKKFATTVIDRLPNRCYTTPLHVDVPKKQFNSLGIDAFPLIEFIRKHPECNIVITRNPEAGEQALSEGVKKLWETVIQERSPTWQDWLDKKSIVEVQLHNGFYSPIRIVVRAKLANSFEEKLWLDRRNSVVEKLDFARVYSVHFGINYG